MKKLIAILLLLVLLISLSIGVSAVSDESSTVIYFQESSTEDGYTIIDTITLCPQLTRSGTKTATRSATVYREGTLIAEIAFTATFHYDGTTVSVISKAVTQTDTYNGWNYKQQSFTSSGGTVTLEAKLTKLLIFNNSFTMRLSCDTDGNITIA